MYKCPERPGGVRGYHPITKFIHEATLPIGEWKDWDADQTAKKVDAQAKVDAWNALTSAQRGALVAEGERVPRTYAMKLPPAWMLPRLKIAHNPALYT